MDVEITLSTASLTLNAAAAAGLNKINIENVQNFATTVTGSASKTDFLTASSLTTHQRPPPQ